MERKEYKKQESLQREIELRLSILSDPKSKFSDKKQAKKILKRLGVKHDI